MQAEEATNGETKRKRGRPKQQKLPGTERKDRNKKIEAAAEAFRDANDHWAELARERKQTRDALVAVLCAEGVNEYRCDDLDMLVTLTPTDVKLKVQRLSDLTEDTGDDE